MTEPLQGAPAPSSALRVVSLVAWWAAYGALAVGLVAIGIDTAIHFSGPAIDGPFQLHNALRRIAVGQRIGADFQFFHGAGVPFLHYPLFAAFGGDFFASELARQIVSTALCALAVPLLFAAWTRDAGSTARLSLGVLCLVIVTRSDALVFPINSLLGVRATMPLLLGAAMAFLDAGVRRGAIVGVTIGLGLLLGTEQGLAMLVAFGAVTVLSLPHSTDRRQRILELAIGLVVAVATYVVAVASVGGWRGVAGAYAYNFGIIPREQFWYFGAPPNRFLFDVRQLWHVPTMALRLAIIGSALMLTAYRVARARGRLDRLLAAETYLALYAIVSMVSIFGTLVAVYLQPAVRVAFVLLLLAVHRFDATRTPATFRRWIEGIPRLVRWREAIVVSLIVAFTMYMRGLSVTAALRAPVHVVAVHAGGVAQGWSTGWDRHRAAGRRALAEAPATAGQTPIWSTYATVVEADAGLLHPSFDYLIHALGADNRRAYVDAFRAARPAVAQTIRPTHTIYEEWLENNHWELYRELLRDYRVHTMSEWGIFWTRRDSAASLAPVIVAEGPVQRDQPGIALEIDAPAGAHTLLEVRLRYHVENPWHRVPFFGRLPRYLVAVDSAANRTPVSLAPYESERVFPVVIRGRTTVVMTFSAPSLLPGPRLVVDSVRVTRLDIPREALAWALDFSSPRGGPSPPY